jgi:Domain of unknown function (DUF4190)
MSTMPPTRPGSGPKPFSTGQGRGLSNDDFGLPADRRTSVLAIFSLILGVLCFLPVVPGVLALILGGAAIVLISRSNGKLAGMGLAITGVVLGLLSSLLWVSITIGVVSTAKWVTNAMLSPPHAFITAAIAGDPAKARDQLVAGAKTQVSDEQIKEFGAKVSVALGDPKPLPTGIIEIAQSFGAYRAMKNLPQNQTLPGPPMPMEFAKGQAIVVLQPSGRDIPGTNSAGTGFPLANLGIVQTDGSILWLVDPQTFLNSGNTTGPGLVPPPATTPTAAPAPPTPPSPTDPGSGG